MRTPGLRRAGVRPSRLLTSLLLALTCCGGGGSAATPAPCPDGWVGSACDLCTFAGQGTDCRPGTTADLVDLDAIKALTLEELGYVPEGTEDVDGMTVSLMGFDGGTFRGVHVDGTPMDVNMPSRAALYVPDGWPAPGDPLKAFVYAVHNGGNVIDPIAARIAKGFRIPVLYHGNLRGPLSTWETLGYSDRGKLYEATTGAVINHNTCDVVDLTRGNFAWGMALTDMRAITLLQRLVELNGASIGSVALRGFSKEGEAGWLAAAVDDRIEVGGFGGWPRQSRLGWLDSWIDAYGCAGGSEQADAAAGLATVKDWALHTPAGAAWLNRFDLGLNQAELRPRLLLIEGDLHLPTMHDGERSMLGGETAFLAGLTVAHRYWRKTSTVPGAGEEGDATTRQVLPVLLAEMLVRGAGTEETYYPRVVSADAVLNGPLLEVSAVLTAPTETAEVWLSWSDDRIWNEVGQAPWMSFPLTRQGATWEATVDLQAAGGFQDKVIAWFVDARGDFEFEGVVYPRRDASPVRFLNQPPPVRCDAPPQPFCAND